MKTKLLIIMFSLLLFSCSKEEVKTLSEEVENGKRFVSMIVDNNTFNALYNNKGQLTELRGSNNQNVFFVYDENGRLKQKSCDKFVYNYIYEGDRSNYSIKEIYGEKVTEYKFVNNRLIEIVEDGVKTIFTYEGNVVKSHLVDGDVTIDKKITYSDIKHNLSEVNSQFWLICGTIGFSGLKDLTYFVLSDNIPQSIVFDEKDGNYPIYVNADYTFGVDSEKSIAYWVTKSDTKDVIPFKLQINY